MLTSMPKQMLNCVWETMTQKMKKNENRRKNISVSYIRHSGPNF